MQEFDMGDEVRQFIGDVAATHREAADRADAMLDPGGKGQADRDALVARASAADAYAEALARRPRAYRTSDDPPPADVTVITDGDTEWQRVDPDGCRWALRPNPGVELTAEQIDGPDAFVERWADLDQGEARLVVDATRPVDWIHRDQRVPAEVRTEGYRALAELRRTAVVATPEQVEKMHSRLMSHGNSGPGN